jgi:hypothetical protein
VIIFDGCGEAISYNDESSPHSHLTGHTKVCIDAQVNRALSLDWFQKLRALFPNISGELKSAVVVARFKDLQAETRDTIWRSLHRVRIHIVDPRPYYRRIDSMIRRAWRNEGAPERLREMAGEGLPAARLMLAKAREFVADSVLRDSTAVRVQLLGRALSDPLFALDLPEPLSTMRGSRHNPAPAITLEDFGGEDNRNIVRSVASWGAKGAAAFHAALDAAQNPGTDDAMDFGRSLRRRMTQELLPQHAFDKGNMRHIDLLEQSRQSMIEELAANERIYRLMGRRPGFVELESKESHYVQAADIAAGIASDIYASRKLVGVVERFEYVTFNGVRVSRADAEEYMKNEDSDEW